MRTVFHSCLKPRAAYAIGIIAALLMVVVLVMQGTELWVTAQHRLTFAVGYGMAFCLAHLIGSAVLIRRGQTLSNSVSLWLGIAVFVLGLRQLSFLFISQASIFAVLEQLYSLTAYGLLGVVGWLGLKRYEYKDQKLKVSQKEINELKMALDAHAIVAVTDSRGVITRVNDKFCTISQYSREDLICRTHKVIN